MAIVPVACGGGDAEPTATADRDGADDASHGLAELQVIDGEVTIHASGASPSPATSGAALAVDDTVRTDATGFAAVELFDGSVTRLDHDAELRIVALSDDAASPVISTELVRGRSWNQIPALGSGATWSQHTPVADAEVGGTAYLADCDEPSTCTFAVFEGTVELAAGSDEPLLVAAGQQVTVTGGQTPGAPTPIDPTVEADSWVVENRQLDTRPAPAGDDPGGDADAGDRADAGGGGGSAFSGTWAGSASEVEDVEIPGYFVIACEGSRCDIATTVVPPDVPGAVGPGPEGPIEESYTGEATADGLRWTHTSQSDVVGPCTATYLLRFTGPDALEFTLTVESGDCIGAVGHLERTSTSLDEWLATNS